MNLKNQKLLVIAPHADDEVLGCGGLISKIKAEGGKAYVLIFNTGSVIKTNPDKNTLIWKNETNEAMKFLKVDDYDIIFDSPDDNRFLDMKPLHFLIETIESSSKVSIDKIKPTIVAIPTNHSHHQDHVRVFAACIAALRPMRDPISKIVLAYEAPEHSKWSINGAFEPNMFVNIEKKYLENKIKAFYKYKSQIKPGGRDKDTIRNQAAYRGRDAGKNACEAFEVLRFIV